MLTNLAEAKTGVFWDVEDNDFELTNFIIITRNGMELALAHESSKKAGHNIFFANPLHGPRICECRYEMKSYDLTTEIWVWETLATGGDPLVKTKRDAAEVSNKEDDVKDSVSQD
ncbi:hypothetical protein Bca52824_077893 [Brassica carinata]|uniref:Uncharacterized protein n=1 Tax=Brassica carinata TaxID=52824 RepID=A0A8X7TYM5_BRACI|nr:hypothetical protein Bca52824_077893 [Brassica carinata]